MMKKVKENFKLCKTKMSYCVASCQELYDSSTTVLTIASVIRC